MTNYIKHPLILPDTVEQRLYQLDLAGRALSSSTLIVLPTGLGKTIVSLLVIAARIEKYGGRALVLSPTKPLVEQHAAFFKKVMKIPEEQVITFTGSVAPEKRAELWKTGKVIVSTPQVIENDVLTKRINLEDVCHITFDEAHRAVGNYAYTYIAEKYFENAKNPHCLGITASPGSTDEKISEVCEALHIRSVAVKTESDNDVRPYIHKKEIEWIKIDLPKDMIEIKGLLEKVIEERFTKLTELGYPVHNQKFVTKKELLGMQKKLQEELRGMPDPAVYGAISIVAEIMKVNHAVEIIETQGIESLCKYMERLEHEAYSKSGSKASKRLAEDLYMRQAIHRIKDTDSEHPKLDMVKNIVFKQIAGRQESRVIVFTNYRDTADMVTAALETMEDIRPIRFVGQSSKYKDKGLTQKQQVQIIEDFKKGTYNVLVATSVAEEGLDIPSTDLVVFYEPIPSEIRSIQRKGRTARKHAGRVVVLVTKGTRDEGYYWSSLSKERRMQSNMKELQELMPANNSTLEQYAQPQVEKDQKQLSEFDNEGIRIVIDHREVRSQIARELEKLGAEIDVKTLEVGDYVVSERIAIERKSAEDFVNSLLNNTLFEQVSNISRSYEKPALLIEGEGLFSARQISPKAIHGTLASIGIDFGVSIFYTRDAEDSAILIHTLAKREQSDDLREIKLHGKKASQMLSEQQEYIVSAISEIGPKAAKTLLQHFGSVENVMKAEYEELIKVPKIGPKTAARIREVVSGDYKG
ncbi:MAG: DEAD/DEAH box helicase [Methanomethylovorans sp.]|uniref:DEAD/DEAH box helicase n=1 Tax=Methanomethylovorans sp. TaxID=2758717 RepID=UPI003530BA95